MKMKLNSHSPMPKPVLLENDLARSWPMMMPSTRSTIQPTNGTMPIRKSSSHHQGRPITFSRM